MPLHDHFHNPLKDYCPWTSFHSNWAVKMVDRLNAKLRTRDYRAHTEVHLGTQIAADIGALERDRPPALFDPHGTNGLNGANGGGGVAVAAEVYAPPVAILSAEVAFAEPDLFEVKVYRGGGTWTLVAAIELVGPSNKDQDETRRAFAIKCAAYLQKGVSVAVVDVVTERRANLHGDLADLLGLPAALAWESPSGLSAVAYRTAKKTGKERETVRLDVWPHPLAVGQPLPTVPLWLAPGMAVPLELEATYAAACDSLVIE
jgi:hypothetical protein